MLAGLDRVQPIDRGPKRTTPLGHAPVHYVYEEPAPGGLIAAGWIVFAVGLLPIHNLLFSLAWLVAIVWLAIALIRHPNQAAKTNGIILITIVAVLNILALAGGLYLATAFL